MNKCLFCTRFPFCEKADKNKTECNKFIKRGYEYEKPKRKEKIKNEYTSD